MFTHTRKQLNAMLWRLSAPRARGHLAGTPALLVMRGNVPQLLPVSALTDREARRLAEVRLMASRREEWRASGLTMVHTWTSVPWAVVYGDGEHPRIAHLLTGEIRAIFAATTPVSFGLALRWATAEARRLNALTQYQPQLRSLDAKGACHA